MKILYRILAIAMILPFWACEEESKTMISEDLTPPVVTAPSGDATVVVTETNMDTNMEVTWDEADYGVDLEVTYIVQMDFRDNLFTDPAILGSTQQTSVSLTYGELNEIVIADLNQAPNESAELEIRVIAVSTGFDDLNSDYIDLAVTTFQSGGEPPVIAAMDATTITSGILDDAYELEWSAADFGTTAEIVYTVEVDVEGGDFSNAALLGTTTATSLSINHEALNFYLTGNLMQANNSAVNAAFRVTANTPSNELVSELAMVAITTLDATQPGTLWAPGSYQGWDPATAPVINHVSDHYFDGYVYFQESAGFKFTSAPNWDNTNFGYDDATTPAEGVTAVLTKDGSKDGMSIDAGFYRCQVDTSALTFTATLVESFGLIGTATAGGWDTSTPMEYDAASGTWRATADLIVGALKFRANDGWGINYGVGDINSRRGALYFDGASYDVKEEGNYTVILSFDVSHTPYQFNYEIIKNN